MKSSTPDQIAPASAPDLWRQSILTGTDTGRTFLQSALRLVDLAFGFALFQQKAAIEARRSFLAHAPKQKNETAQIEIVSSSAKAASDAKTRSAESSEPHAPTRRKRAARHIETEQLRYEH